MVSGPPEQNRMTPTKPIDGSTCRHLYPFTSRYLDLDGLRYHYVDEGVGDPVLMIHGNPTWSFYYRQLIAALSSEYRTIAPDHIGCGLSDKPEADRYDYRLDSRIRDLQRFIASLDLKSRLTLVLHDWGGMIGMAYAVNHPQTISRLILLNTAAYLPPEGKPLPLRLALIRRLPLLARPAVLSLNLFCIGALYMASCKGLSPQVKAGLIAPYNSRHNRIAVLKFVEDIPLNSDDPSYATVASVDARLDSLSDIPTLICWGARDFVFDADYLSEWRERFPKAEVYLFQKAGHYVLEDEPDRIIRLVRDFLKRHPL